MRAAALSVVVPSRALAPAAADLLERAAALSAAGIRARQGADPEAVHDLRVAARRVEASLRVWGPAGGEPAAKAARAARRGARRLRRAAGDAREFEVHVTLLEECLASLSPAEREPLTPVLDDLRAQRDAARLEVARHAGRRSFEKLERRVTEVAAALAGTPAEAGQADQRVGRARRRAAAAIARAAGTDRDARLHAARVALKKWRYAGESRAAAPPAPEPAPFRDLRAAQQALGAAHDHAVLLRLLRRLARRAAREGATARSQALDALAPRVERARRALTTELAPRLRALAPAVKR